MSTMPIDQNALIDTFAKATAQQGEALRQAVSGATLKALQSREVTLASVRQAVATVAQATTLGLAKNNAPKVDLEAMLGSALAGIDAALLQAVDANRQALETFSRRGGALADKPLHDALAMVEKMEDTFFAAVGQAAKSAGSLQTPWSHALEAYKAQGTASGAEASQLAASMLEQAKEGMRSSRAAGMRASQAMLSGYAAMVGGILSGMSEGMRAGRKPEPSAAPAAPAAERTAAKRTTAKRKPAKRPT